MNKNKAKKVNESFPVLLTPLTTYPAETFCNIGRISGGVKIGFPAFISIYIQPPLFTTQQAIICH